MWVAIWGQIYENKLFKNYSRSNKKFCFPRLLPCQIKESADSDCSSVVQGSFQGLEAFCEGEVERQGLHCEHASGSYGVPRVVTHPLFVACFAPFGILGCHVQSVQRF